MSEDRGDGWRQTVFGLVFAMLLATAAHAGTSETFPEPRPQSRAEAAALLASGRALDACLTPHVQALGAGSLGGSPVHRRAAALLRAPIQPSGRWIGRTDAPIRIIDLTYPITLDGVAPSAAEALTDPVLAGFEEARSLLVTGLGLAEPGSWEVVLANLGGSGRGYLIAGESHGAGRTLVLDGSNPRDTHSIRRAAAHQFAHAVALVSGPRISPAWGEALAEWVDYVIEGRPDAAALDSFSDRLARLHEGLVPDEPLQGSANALWLIFVAEQYGRSSVRATVEELGRGGSAATALDRALRRVAGADLATGFREFHLWSALIGARADTHHFPFAARLRGPAYASENDGLPALSVQVDPPVAPLGATQIRFRPQSTDGGLRVHFDGDLGGRWEADLLLLRSRGRMHRVALEISAEGRGETVVPLDSVGEAILLVRNLGSDDPGPHRYTYAATLEPGYPVELRSFEALPAAADGHDVMLTWETASEQDLVGYNVVRVREAGGREVVLNPIWIPAVGDRTNATSYVYLDQTAVPGEAYLYRIEALTRQGLSSVSDAVVLRRGRSAR